MFKKFHGETWFDNMIAGERSGDTPDLRVMFKDGTVIITEGLVYVVMDGKLLPPVPIKVVKDLLIWCIEHSGEGEE